MRVSWFSRGDLDGFFGLFIDNLLQLMLIAVLCEQACGLPRELIIGRMLPGAALSVLAGNFFYAWQARRLMAKTGRNDVTALPYGINTPSLMAFVFLVMAPVYHQTLEQTHNAESAWHLTWQVGLFACIISGIIEIIGAFVGDWLRRHTPLAALLSALAGVAITFIAMGFIFQIFASPVIAIIPMMLILASYAGRLKLPMGVPGGFVAVLLGVAIAWMSRLLGATWFQPAPINYHFGLHLPVPAFGDAFALLTGPQGWQYMGVILPMSLFNILGSLQNLSSAEAGGDRFETRPSLLANGICGLVAALFGSPFPTTIYIGHPGWKAMGARAGYSILNGVAIALICLFGAVGLVLHFVPLEATLGILLWIGIIMTAQAFAEVPRRHALAVAVGLIPALAAWGLLLVETALRVAGSSLYEAAPKFGADLYIHGMIALNQGFLLSSMVLASIAVFMVERKFIHAAGWALAAAMLSMIGLIHAYTLTPAGVENKFGFAAAPLFGLAYAATAVLLVLVSRLAPKEDSSQRGPTVDSLLTRGDGDKTAMEVLHDHA
jgi:AGZA family xanthine/uracil permease-like MFS transporter